MLWWLSPGDPERRTGGFIYNARIVEALRSLGHDVCVLRMDANWPFPDEVACRGQLISIPDGDTVVADGLMWSGLSADDRRTLTSRCRVWVVVHSPLDMEGGGAEVVARECDSLRQADGWWATSRPTAALMSSRLATPEAHCICPGTEVALHHGDRSASRLLTVAHLIPRKGHDRLFDALALLKDLDWHLSLVGSASVDSGWARMLHERAAALGISRRLSWLGTLDGSDLQRTMADHGLLVHPARYEAYGMVLTEALASGLPVLSTAAGALDGLASSAITRLSSSGDAADWAETLRQWLLNHQQQREASLAASTLGWPSWVEQARALTALLAMPGG